MDNISALLKDGYTLNMLYEITKERCTVYQKKMQESCRFVREKCEDYQMEIIKQANQYMQGMMVLCGTMGKQYFVGNPPKWSENPLNDNEFVWQLNRMEHWVTLIRAYYLTGEEKYAVKVLSELEDWIDSCPPLEITLDYKTAKSRFSSVHPWRSLEVGMRAHKSWNCCLETLSCLPLFSEELFEKMVLSLYQHAEILYKVCPVIWPNADHNHYLTECLGLLEISGILPFFKESDQWREHALREMERCSVSQVTESGGQVEGCPTYHNECLHWLGYSLNLAEKYEIEFSSEYKKRVQSMFLYSIYSTRPDGTSVPWGDSDVQPYVYDAAYQMYIYTGNMEPLAYCSKLFNKDSLLDGFYKNIWDIKNPFQLFDLLKNSTLDSEVEFPSYIHFNSQLKQVMMRTGWTSDAASLFFACRTPVHNDHAHIDPNGFDYFNKGIPILVDAGRYNYQEGMNRQLFKGGTYHNTLLIDQKNAFEYIGTWEYGEQKIGDILNVGNSDGWNYTCGMHCNYFPVVHTRMMIFNENLLVIMDRVDNMKDINQVNIYYNMNSSSVELDPKNKIITSEIDERYISMAFSSGLECKLLKGRASTCIDYAVETTIINLNSFQNSRLYVTALYVGKEYQSVEIAQVTERDEKFNTEILVGNNRYGFTWDYCNNIVKELT